MKNISLLIIFLVVCISSYGQSALDSLYTVWQDKTQTDSVRITALSSYISKGYLRSKPDSALIIADTLIKFSRSKGNIKGAAIGLTYKGRVYYKKDDYEIALDLYQQSLDIYEELDDKAGIASIYNNFGSVYKNKDNNIQALNYYLKSLKIKEEMGAELVTQASTINNIALIYLDQGNHSKALEFAQRSHDIYEATNNKINKGITLGVLGNIYLDQGDYNNALIAHRKGLQIFEEYNAKGAIAEVNKQIGINYIKQGGNGLALNYLQTALALYEEQDAEKGIASTLVNIGHIYLSENNYSKAITTCKRSFELSKKIGTLKEQKESCECLYDSYKALNDGNNALVYHELMMRLNDSLQEKETAQKLMQMENRNQFVADSLVQVKKDLEVDMKHQAEVRKKEKNKDIFMAVGLLFFLLAGGFYSRWRYVKKSKGIIEKEKDRSDNLLLNILPAEIAEELKEKGKADARDFDQVSILFTDFQGFTEASEQLSAKDLIKEINHCFYAFDQICETHGVEKIKTIGDAYMAAGGLPILTEDSVKNTILAALDMQAFIAKRIAEKNKANEISFKMRLGIHTGSVVAGIVGTKKFQYDIWGDTVNTAARMESSGEIGKVNISQDTYELVKDDAQFKFEPRGKIKAKGKGEIEMYFVTKVW